MRRLVVAVALVAAIPCAAKDIPASPGLLLCRDKALALSYVRTSASLVPSPQFRCFPVAPGTILTEVGTVVPNVRGNRLIEIVARYPGYAPIVAYTFVPAAPPPAKKPPVPRPAPTPAQVPAAPAQVTTTPVPAAPTAAPEQTSSIAAPAGPPAALVPHAHAADPSCAQFKSRLVAAARALQQARLPAPVIRYVQQQDLVDPIHEVDTLQVFDIPIVQGEANLYCRGDQFDSFDVIFGLLREPLGGDFNTLQQFRYLVTAALMAFTQGDAGDALKSLDKLVADVNASRDANIVLGSHAVIHLYGGDHLNFQLNSANAAYGPSPGKQ